jgi:hypothetical protein
MAVGAGLDALGAITEGRLGLDRSEAGWTEHAASRAIAVSPAHTNQVVRTAPR